MKIIVTGGAGYIGSHTTLELLRSGHEVYVIDNLSNGNLEALRRVERLTNSKLKFSEADVRDSDKLNVIFAEFIPDAVVHFAGVKSVKESVSNPAKYFDVNVGGTAVLLAAMELTGCANIVFSSSATVYGNPVKLPCVEDHPTDPINAYGHSKAACEVLLSDWAYAAEDRCAVALRYFNPVGADVSGELGECPSDTPQNLMPIIVEVAAGQRSRLEVYGDDYSTFDGTGVRDYIHVVDLARAHVCALGKLASLEAFEVINVGTGSGISVLQMIEEFERQTGTDIRHVIVPRRPGDAPAVWSDVSKMRAKLGYNTQYDLADMCKTAWCWKLKNKNGYK